MTYVVRVVCTGDGTHGEVLLEKLPWDALLADTDHLAAYFPADHPLRSDRPLMSVGDGLKRSDRRRLLGHASYRWRCDACRRVYQFRYEAVAEAVERHAEGGVARVNVATIG